MERVYVVTSLQYRPEDSNAPPTQVHDLGFSLIRLMQLSKGEATGVRANLQINDQTALKSLSQYYKTSTRLEWTFEIGGGGSSVSAPLRWTKFDQSEGSLQVVRTAVCRDLISEVEGDTNGGDHQDRTDSGTAEKSHSRTQRQQTADQETTRPSSPEIHPESQSGSTSIQQQLSALLSRILHRDSPLQSGHTDHK